VRWTARESHRPDSQQILSDRVGGSVVIIGAAGGGCMTDVLH